MTELYVGNNLIDKGSQELLLDTYGTSHQDVTLVSQIPDSVSILGVACMSGNTRIRYLEIPDTVTVLEDSCFSGDTNLLSVTIPDSVVSIGKYCFSGCSSLTSITLPDSVTSIGESCFLSCTNLTELILSKSLTTLPKLLAGYSSKLPTITIPASVTTIEAGCFNKYNSYLNTVYFEGDPPLECTDSFSGMGYITFYYKADNPNWTEQAKSDFLTQSGINPEHCSFETY